MFSRTFVISNDYLYELFIFLEFKSLNPFLSFNSITLNETAWLSLIMIATLGSIIFALNTISKFSRKASDLQDMIDE